MTAPTTFNKVDAFWALYFGCSPREIAGTQTIVVSHAALQGYDGALAFRHGDGLIVSVPPSVPEVERAKLRQAPPAIAFDPRFLAKVFVVSADKVTGPGWVGIVDARGFRPVPSGARLLGDADEGAMRKLAEACGEVAWHRSTILQIRQPLFGLFQGPDLVAVSGYVVMGSVLAYIGVIAHPAHRGKGFAKMVVSSAVAEAVRHDLVAQLRTTQANESAVALAQSLGFRHYASTYDVKLVEDEF
jgi:ribosomal protein S18 acetylase RimI-like enzyme